MVVVWHVRSCLPQGDIGAAESRDGGLTWKHVGIALDEKWHLSYPFLFEHQGKVGTLRLLIGLPRQQQQQQQQQKYG